VVVLVALVARPVVRVPVVLLQVAHLAGIDC
jgi:hypothetical protein